jgi:hypothetical protein
MKKTGHSSSSQRDHAPPSLRDLRKNMTIGRNESLRHSKSLMINAVSSNLLPVLVIHE